jgi:hypothetical protein
MARKPSSEELQAQTVTRLVDESLRGGAPRTAEPWAGDPDVERQVASQRRVAQALRTDGPLLPDTLRATLEGRVRERYGSAPSRSKTTGRGSASMWRPAIAVPAALVACAVAAVLVIGVGGGGSQPSIPAAARLALAPSTGPAPATRNARLLDLSYAGVTYPSYATFAVPPTGRRRDRLGGRPALTVFYRLRDGTRLSYTVFSGTPISVPGNARTVVYDGVKLRVFSTRPGLTVVTLVRFGRTCVLAAHASAHAVLALAEAPLRGQVAA